jgi:hypothetical protein
MLGLASPIFLWSLLGLSVPIAIHFWNKKKKRPLPIGSVRFLEHQESRKFKNLQLKDKRLLLLRLLLLAVMSLILAQPFWTATSSNTGKHYAFFDPNLETDMVVSYSKLMQEKGVEELRWFQPGFPLLSASPEKSKYPSWDLIKSWTTFADMDQATIIHTGNLAAFQGRKVDAFIPIQWYLQPLPIKTWKIATIGGKGERFLTSEQDNERIIIGFSEQNNNNADTTLVLPKWELIIKNPDDSLSQYFTKAIQTSAEIWNLELSESNNSYLDSDLILTSSGGLSYHFYLKNKFSSGFWRKDVRGKNLDIHYSGSLNIWENPALYNGKFAEELYRIIGQELELPIRQIVASSTVSLMYLEDEVSIKNQEGNSKNISLIPLLMIIFIVLLLWERWWSGKKFAK